MRKKVIIALFVIISLFAAVPASSQSVDRINGFDWVNWSFDKQVGYIEGFMSAYVTVIQSMLYEGGDALTDDQFEEIENRFFINLNVGEIGQRIDEYYSSYANRSDRLHNVFLLVIGKDYWN